LFPELRSKREAVNMVCDSIFVLGLKRSNEINVNLSLCLFKGSLEAVLM